MGKLQPMWMAYVDENNYVDEKTYSKTFVRRKANLRAVDGASVVDVIAVTQAVTQMTGTYVRLN